MAASAGSITFSSPAAGSSFKGSQSYTIAGAVSPAPGQPDNAFITVKNPSGTTVDAASVAVSASTGDFSYSTAVGGSSSWVTGTYTITATDSYGATGTTTFAYTAAAVPAAGLALEIYATASTPVYAGQTAQISALVAWNNGTAATGASFKVFLVSPSGTATPLTASPTTPTSGDYWWTYPVPSGSADGLYAFIVGATSGSFTVWTQTSFTVNSQIASQGSISGLGSTFTTLQKDLGGNFSALSTAVGTVGTAVSGVSSTLTSIQTTLGNINTAVQNLSGLSSQLTSVSSSISTTQTYVLVVAVLAAITLVLELAILVRKLS
jgi:hypothetical protein